MFNPVFWKEGLVTQKTHDVTKTWILKLRFDYVVHSPGTCWWGNVTERSSCWLIIYRKWGWSMPPVMIYRNRCDGSISVTTQSYIDGLVQDCSNSIASTQELLQSGTKPSIFDLGNKKYVSAGMDYKLHPTTWIVNIIAAEDLVTFGARASAVMDTDFILMAQCKTAVSPLLMHWRYCSLVLHHRYIDYTNGQKSLYKCIIYEERTNRIISLRPNIAVTS